MTKFFVDMPSEDVVSDAELARFLGTSDNETVELLEFDLNGDSYLLNLVVADGSAYFDLITEDGDPACEVFDEISTNTDKLIADFREILGISANKDMAP